MTKRFDWGTLYLVKPGWKRDDENDDDVVDAYDKTVSCFDQAIELWRLAGNDERASQIQAVLDRVYAHPDAVIDTAQLDDMIRLLSGLDEALLGTVLDEHLNVPASRLPELRQHIRTIDLGEGGGRIPTAAIGSAMGNVEGLRNILLEARERGLHVALD
jgi:hypothetical protein